jgi:hypothetical protein
LGADISILDVRITGARGVSFAYTPDQLEPVFKSSFSYKVLDGGYKYNAKAYR